MKGNLSEQCGDSERSTFCGIDDSRKSRSSCRGDGSLTVSMIRNGEDCPSRRRRQRRQRRLWWSWLCRSSCLGRVLVIL
ncbi:hypothetical protein CYLTODRAFT_159990 [Cylindrobasidium torrendii FP15055 ss-10]|uniref:Uncharacterized protein n=1 Tax=Cylindrobasidium torrendii FP15055 ss-10 TaxID=1314674 RepID=A0A0D7AY46_9AGAR|nr:hypothetical protein CYLTODRAFT_159990 [Cylindrobasidium torrendii FP15055 ss-10]